VAVAALLCWTSVIAAGLDAHHVIELAEAAARTP
jgi:hypothetical protein